MMVEKIHDNGKEEKMFFACGLESFRNSLQAEAKFVNPGTFDPIPAEQTPIDGTLRNVLVRIRELDRVEREVTLQIQRDFASVASVLHEISGTRRMMDKLLHSSHNISSEQINKAREEQKREDVKMGETLVRLGFLEERALDAAILSKSIQGDNELPSWPLGKILILSGYITQEHLDDALDRQLESGKKLGEILVEENHCAKPDIEHGLHIQKHLVEAILIAALSLGPAKEALSSAQTHVAMTTNIQVTARVLARASVNILRQPSQIVITEADIRRGFLDASIGSLVEVRNNTRAGVDLIFEAGGVENFPFKEVVVRGLGREVFMRPNGGVINCPVTGTRIMELSYRFILDKSSQAGTYTWPFSLSAAPVE